MATSFEEVYCLNSVIKIDQRLNNKPSYALYELMWKYLQFAITFFQFDCRMDLLDLVPFSLTEYEFIGDGENNIFELDPAPSNIENLKFYISSQIDCGKAARQISDYIWDETNHTITFTKNTPAIGEKISISSYVIGQFNSTLGFIEKRILAEGMNIPYYEEQLTNSKVLNFATYGGSIKMHSQAEQLKQLKETYAQAKRELEGDISAYSYRTAPRGLDGLGGRTVCLNQLRQHINPTAFRE